MASIRIAALLAIAVLVNAPLSYRGALGADSTACDSNYTGACVPADAPDVDCLGGWGDGPVYVGRVKVVGVDIYGLDRDSNGIGCEWSPPT